MIRRASREPATHDFTRRAWGHNVQVLQVHRGGHELRVAGWGGGAPKDELEAFVGVGGKEAPLPQIGDYLLLSNEGGTTRYRVKSINPQRDPPDMWFADLEFAPRETSVGGGP